MMQKLLLFLLCLPMLCISACAEDLQQIQEEQFQTQSLIDAVTGESAERLQGFSFGTEDLPGGVRQIFEKAFDENQDAISQAAAMAAMVIAVTLLCATIGTMGQSDGLQPIAIVGALGISAASAFSVHAMITLGSQTVESLSNYATLLLPAMASATVASGAVGSAAALYSGTVLFLSVLTNLISKLLVPMVYAYVGVATANAAMDQHLLDSIRDFIGWLISAGLKGSLYLFTGYITVTGVISGTSDALSVKATKLAMGNMVPVVGGIISDASETVVVSAGILKKSIGIFGMLTVLAFCVAPFLRIAIHYLLMKATKAVCGTIGRENHVRLIGDLSTAMGFLLGMTGVCALMLLISTVCSLRVVGI